MTTWTPTYFALFIDVDHCFQCYMNGNDKEYDYSIYEICANSIPKKWARHCDGGE